MTIDAPQLTQVVNLLIAVGVFGSLVGGFVVKLRTWQRKDVERIIAPVQESQVEIAAKVESNHKDMSERFDRLNSAVLGHESRLSFVEGKEAGRVEGWQQAQRGMPLKQIPREEEL